MGTLAVMITPEAVAGHELMSGAYLMQAEH